MNGAIKSALRIPDLFELFSKQPSGPNLARVAKGLSLLSRSTLGLLRTFCGRENPTREENDAYRLSGMVLRSGSATHDRLLHVAAPVMRTPVDELRETVILAIASTTGMDGSVGSGTGIKGKVPVRTWQTPAALNDGCMTARFAANRDRIVAALRAAVEEIGLAMQREQAA